jgi:hypothetical protein
VKLTRPIKFVAVLLVAGSLVIPGLAVGACLLQSVGARYSEPRCPMMMDTQSGSQIKGQPMRGDGSCCQISTAPPVSRNSAFTNQNWGWAQAHQLQSAGVPINSPAVDETAFPETAPPPSTSSHRALLCVFLI